METSTTPSSRLSAPDWMTRKTFLRGLVGSTAHGLHVEDGLEDRDEMGVCIEPIDAFIGHKKFDQFIYRTAAAREGKHDAKSRAGDLDLTIYSLEKWVRLALRGTPNVLMLLFLPTSLCVSFRAPAGQLQDMAPLFVSQEAGRQFAGYLTDQRARLMGERGGKDVNRPELVEKYGYDTKYAMHMVRLGLQGVEFLSTGRMSLPMREPERSWIRDIRVGKVPLAEVISRTNELQNELEKLIKSQKVPAFSQGDAVWKWVRHIYLDNWSGDDIHFSIANGKLMRRAEAIAAAREADPDCA